MPASLAASKRKFHTLLDNLTSRPGSSRSSVRSTASTGASKDDPLSKRQRLSPRSSAASSNPLSRPEVLRTHGRIPTPNADSDGIKVGARTASILRRKEEERRAALKDEAVYNPWSQQGFLRRLHTFSDLTTWSPGKPDEINELVWAKRGWSCDGLNRVACKKGCEARIVISLRQKRKDAEGEAIEGSEDYSEEVSEELVNRYEKLVVEGHHEGCLWRVGRACADDIYRVGVVRGEQWQRELRERYWSFRDLDQKHLLPVKERLEYPINVEQIAGYLEEDFFDGGPPTATNTSPIPESALVNAATPSINHAALALALTGWQVPAHTSTSNSAPTATCQTCFRRVGLWLYTQPLKPDEMDPMKLDLISSHRHYCPRVNGMSQAMPAGTFDGLPAYEVLQRVIGAWAGMRIRARKSGARPANMASSMQSDDAKTNQVAAGQEREPGAGRGDEEVVVETPILAKSREEVREEDRKKFARLRELTRMMGLKRSKRRPDIPAATTATTATNGTTTPPATNGVLDTVDVQVPATAST